MRCLPWSLRLRAARPIWIRQRWVLRERSRSTQRAGEFGDLLHRSRQHPHAVAQQRGVGRVVDVGLDHGGVDSHSPALHDLALAGDGHQSPMQPLHHRRAQREADPAQRLRIGHLAGAHVRELTVDQVGPHLALEHAVAPVAHVLEHEKPQHHVGRRAAAPARAAVRAAP